MSLETDAILGSGFFAGADVVVAGAGVVVTGTVVVTTGTVVVTFAGVVAAGVVATGVVVAVVSAVVVALSPQETAVRITQNSATRTTMIESFFIQYPF